jgi:hypothetical protein
MKKIFLLLVLFSLLGCEKDDICDENTPTTPRLIIEFYSFSNPTVLKNVVNLKVTADGEIDSLDIFNGVSKIELPLKTVGTSTDLVTKYSFVLNSGAPLTENTDFFQINYTKQEIYVSRACGYKSIFTLANTTPIIFTDTTTPDGFWIKNINIETSNIETENETHIKIYF